MSLSLHTPGRPLRLVCARASIEFALPIGPATRVPPREIQLWNVGENSTDYGVHRWTERSAALVGGEYRRRGNPFQIDIDHNLADGKPRPATAEPLATGGYCALDIRNGAPWLVFDWSAIAYEQIATGQRLFLSPEYYTDESTGEIVAVTRISLVGSPGTHFARRLASSGRRALTHRLAMRAESRTPMDLKMILAVISAALANEDPEAMRTSLESLVTELTKANGDEPAPTDAPVEAEGDEEPIMAEGDEEPVMAEEEKKKIEAAKLAAAKLAQARKVSASAGPGAAAARVIQDAHRDFILETQGERLPAPLRAWCASQPLSIVQGVLAATPKKPAAPAHVTATRGPQAKPETRESKTPKEDLDLMDRVMLGQRATPAVHRDGHKMTFAPMSSGEATQHLAAQAAKKAGK